MLEYIGEICGDKFKSKTDVDNIFNRPGVAGAVL